MLLPLVLFSLLSPATAGNRERRERRRARRKLSTSTLYQECNRDEANSCSEGLICRCQQTTQGRRLFGAPSNNCMCVTASPPPSAPPPSCWGYFDTPLGDHTFATGVTTLDTDANPNGYAYSSMTIPSGATVTAVGSHPLILNVSGAANIAGTLHVDGGNGGDHRDYIIGSGGAFK